MNIYVHEVFRKQGIAYKIVCRLIEEAKVRNCGKIYFKTAAAGRHAYSTLGFRDMDDMMKYYDNKD